MEPLIRIKAFNGLNDASSTIRGGKKMGVYILSVMTKEVVDIATIDFIKRKIEVAFPII